jgi:aminoglycoside phosphotransferase (APT) family kinase protein
MWPAGWQDQPVSKPSQPSPAQVRDLLHSIDPSLRFMISGPLTGGVSAQLTVIDAQLADGQVDRLVLRQYGPANLRADPHVAVHEYALLSLLHRAGLPVPRPRHADETATIMPVPCLIIEYIDGYSLTQPSQLTAPLADFTGQLAEVLARLHAAAFTLADAPYLADIRASAARRVETWPSAPDEALSELAVRTTLARIWPPPLLNQPALLHGDFWPGNALWRDGTLVGVVDWEDAVLGDPLHDVANTRMELCMAFGISAAREFTGQYCERRPMTNMTALRHWDLYAALRHAGRMSEWGLTSGDRKRLEAGHQEFVTAALAALSP